MDPYSNSYLIPIDYTNAGSIGSRLPKPSSVKQKHKNTLGHSIELYKLHNSLAVTGFLLFIFEKPMWVVVGPDLYYSPPMLDIWRS